MKRLEKAYVLTELIAKEKDRKMNRKLLLLMILSSIMMLSTAFAQGKGKRKSKENTSKATIYKAENGVLKSGIFHIRQSWADVEDYDRSVHVQIGRAHV